MTAAAFAMVLLLGAELACPDEARVAEALTRSTPAAVRERHRWSISITAEGLKVVLTGADGTVVRERVVPAPSSCAERETVAAAVLAAWMVATPAAQQPAAQQPPEPAPPPRPAVRSMPAPAPEPAPEVVPVPEPVPVPVPPPAPELIAEPTPVPPPPIVSALPPPLTPTLSPSQASLIRIDIALDARAQLAGSVAPGLGLMVSVGDRLGGFLELSSATARSLPLPPGQVRWFRVALGAGVRYRFDLTELYLEPALSAEAAWLRVEGQGFRQNSIATGFDFSACGQLRAGRFFNSTFAAYVGARGCAWPLANRVGVTGVSDTVALPVFELAALLGVSAGLAVKGSSGSGPSEK